MSGEARPISNSQFALAIQDLPIENIYSKAFEINNSIGHLEKSNTQLQEYSDSIKNDQSLDANTRSEGDKDCLDAIKENKIVIDRQKERINLLKAEVERRGGRWHEANTNGKKEGEDNAQPAQIPPNETVAPWATRGGLSDEEIRRQMEERMGPADDDDNDGGMHL